MNKESESTIRRKISTGELERRWQAVRQAMKEKGLDFLIFQNNVAHLGGYVRWLIDLPVGHGYPATIIFPRDDEMTTIWHGPRPPAEPGPPAWSVRGVRKRVSVPIIPSLGYSSIFDAEKAVEELAPYKNCRIGLVGMGFISAAFYKYVTEHLNSVKFEDVTDMVDDIKAIKSDEEIELIREACKVQDALFEYALTHVQPGRMEYQVHADLLHKCLELGAEEANIMVGSAPAGTVTGIRPIIFGTRAIEDGDQVTLLLETNGPGGMWGELARTICLGKVSPELEEQFELAREAQKATVDLLKPGTASSSLWDANNEFMRNKGYPEERRIYAHGQGYDMVERPSLDPDETMTIRARMNIAVHPGVMSAKAHGWVCDNYIVSETGEAEWLHETPQKVFVV